MLGGAAKLATAGLGADMLAAREAGPRALAAHGVAPNDNVGVFSSSVSGIPAVSAQGTFGAAGVSASSDSSSAVAATSTHGVGVYGASDTNAGVFAGSASGIGLSATSYGSDAVLAQANRKNKAAVHRCAPGVTQPSSNVTSAVFA